jgi:hypothetical protein
MARRKRAAATIAPRKSLLEWIYLDDGDNSKILAPTCSGDVQTLHARIVAAADDRKEQRGEPLQPPPGLGLAPLG